MRQVVDTGCYSFASALKPSRRKSMLSYEGILQLRAGCGNGTFWHDKLVGDEWKHVASFAGANDSSRPFGDAGSP